MGLAVNDVVIVRCSTFRRTRDGYRVTTYSAEEVDVIAAYCRMISTSRLHFDGSKGP
jgi:hypothetical protein